MGLYKPQSQLMTPNNQTIDNQTVNQFITQINGDYCSGYIFRMPTLNGKLNSNVKMNQVVMLDKPLYNEDFLVVDVPKNSFVWNQRNKQLTWNVSLLGKEKKITAKKDISSTVEIVDEAKAKRIEQLNAEIDEQRALMVTYDKEIQQEITKCQYEIAKIKENPNLTQAQKDAQIKVQNDKIASARNRQLILTTEINMRIEVKKDEIASLERNPMKKVTIKETNIALQNGNFQSGDMVYANFIATSDDPKFVPSNTYYIGVMSDGTYKLYDTREKAIARLITGEYHALYFSPNLVNDIVYSTATSDDITFRVIEKGRLALNHGEINKLYHTFVPIYQQENDIPINNYQATLYDDKKNILKQTDIIYSSDLKFYVDTLMSGSAYYVQFQAINNVGYAYDTGLVRFTVSYKQPTIQAPLLAENNCEDSTIDMDWRYLISIHGKIEGCHDFVTGFMWKDNTGLYLCPKAVLTYQLYERIININEQANGTTTGSYPCVVWRPESVDWTGDIIKISKTTSKDYVTIGYDGECIYLDINGVKVRTQRMNIEKNKKTGKCEVYLVGMAGKTTAVHKFIASEIEHETNLVSFDLIDIKSTTAKAMVSMQSFVGITKYEYYINDKKVGEQNTSNITTTFDFTKLTKLTKYKAQVVITDKVGAKVKSNVINFTTTSDKPVIKSVSLTSITRNTARLAVNTISDNPINQYVIEYNDTSLGQPYDVFDLKGLEAYTTCKTKFHVIDNLLQYSNIFNYSFKTVDKELTLVSNKVSDITSYTAKATVKYIAKAGLDKIEWYIDDNLHETSKNSIHTITGLVPNKNYVLNVKLYDLDGTWVISEDIHFKTEPLPPIIHSVKVTEVTNHSATFDVDAEAQSVIDTYEVINNK